MRYAGLQHVHRRVVQPGTAEDKRRAGRITVGRRAEPWLLIPAPQQRPAGPRCHLRQECHPPEPPRLEADRPVQLRAVHDPRAAHMRSRPLAGGRRTGGRRTGGCGLARQAAERRAEMVNQEVAVGAPDRGAHGIAVAQRADPDHGPALRLAGRDDDRREHRHAGCLADRSASQRRGCLRHRLEGHRGWQHRDAVDLVLGQVRVGAQRQPGVADQLDARIVHPRDLKEPAGRRRPKRATGHCPRRRDASPAVHGYPGRQSGCGQHLE